MTDEVLVPPAPIEPTPTPPPVTAESWPSNWRQSYATSRNDPKLLSRLERYSDPSAAFDALINVQQKIGAGELRSNQPFPDKGTDEEKNAWRTANGVPVSHDKYELKLAPGTVLGEEDKPIVDAYTKYAHEHNLSGSAVNASLAWYMAEKGRQDAVQMQADAERKAQIDAQLKVEWGPDYQTNSGKIMALLDSAPEGTRDMLLNARMPDGSKLHSNIGAMRWLVSMARELNPSATVVHGDSATQIQAMDREIADLLRDSAAGKHTAAYQKYWKEGGEKRLRDLYQSKELIQRRQR